MIRLLTGIAGNDFSHAPGEKIEMSADEEKRMVESGQAEFVAKETKKKAKNK